MYNGQIGAILQKSNKEFRILMGINKNFFVELTKRIFKAMEERTAGRKSAFTPEEKVHMVCIYIYLRKSFSYIAALYNIQRSGARKLVITALEDMGYEYLSDDREFFNNLTNQIKESQVFFYPKEKINFY